MHAGSLWMLLKQAARKCMSFHLSSQSYRTNCWFSTANSHSNYFLHTESARTSAALLNIYIIIYRVDTRPCPITEFQLFPGWYQLSNSCPECTGRTVIITSSCHDDWRNGVHCQTQTMQGYKTKNVSCSIKYNAKYLHTHINIYTIFPWKEHAP